MSTSTREELEALAIQGRAKATAAFKSRDPKNIAACFCKDGSFINGRGAIPGGDVYQGYDAIVSFFEKLLEETPDVNWTESSPPIINGNQIITQWRRTATTKTGQKQDWLGLDIYTFKGTEVYCKNTFIKDVKQGSSKN